MNDENKTTQENKQQDEPSGQLGRHDETAKADIPVFKPNGRPWVLRTFLIIIMILLLALAGLFGWLWWQERNDNNKENSSAQTSEQSSEESEEQAANECSENFSVYANESLDVEFCYPTAWGEVEVSDAKFAAADAGSRWRLSFTEKSPVNLGLVSADWSTEIPRDGTCVDPAAQVLPAFSPFSTDWTVEIETDTSPPQADSAFRGIEVEEDKFLIQERVDNLLTNGVCLNGYAIIENGTYPHSAASYYAEFDGGVTSPQQHIDNPDILVPATDQADFATFIKSIKAYSS